MSKAMISGTFDPVTVGHIDIIKRAANLFDEVIVVMFVNSSKQTYFTEEQRFEMLRLSCVGIDNVKCDISDRLLAAYVIDNNIDVIVKGIRNIVDYELEYQMFVINNVIDKRIETFFIPARPEHIHVSSTVVREMLRYNVDISSYVTESVKNYIMER